VPQGAEGGPMITFRCTKKVRDLLGLTDRDLDDESEGELYDLGDHPKPDMKDHLKTGHQM
jgi:hypothetical protein